MKKAEFIERGFSLSESGVILDDAGNEYRNEEGAVEFLEEEERFFIFDCNGRIVGNPKGYRTMRGALQQHDRKGSPAWRAIWAAFDSREDKNSALISRVTTRSGWGSE